MHLLEKYRHGMEVNLFTFDNQSRKNPNAQCLAFTQTWQRQRKFAQTFPMISLKDLLPCLSLPASALEMSMAFGKAWLSVAWHGAACVALRGASKLPSPT